MSKNILTVLGIVAIALGIVAFNAMLTVHQTQQALVLQFGEYKLVCARHPGWDMKAPAGMLRGFLLPLVPTM